MPLFARDGARLGHFHGRAQPWLPLPRLQFARIPHDNRTRPSVLLSRDDHHVVIDTTPDFRFQALRYELDRLDAIVYTHGHADHILGFDDIRPFNLRQKAAVPIYASKETLAILRRDIRVCL